MKTEYSRLGKVLIEKKEILQEKNDQYDMIIENPWYKKYQAAKLLEEDNDSIAWKKTITQLIDMFDQMRSVETRSPGITLQDFQVTLDGEVRVRWVVDDIRSIYIPWGLLDQFIDFDFLEHIDIPQYSKSNENDFNFILNATIVSDGWKD